MIHRIICYNNRTYGDILKKVTLFALSTCTHCQNVKLFLDQHNFTYTLIEVDTLDSGEQWLMTKELGKHNPKGTFPTTVIEEVVLGYNPEYLNQVLSDEGCRGTS